MAFCHIIVIKNKMSLDQEIKEATKKLNNQPVIPLVDLLYQKQNENKIRKEKEDQQRKEAKVKAKLEADAKAEKCYVSILPDFLNKISQSDDHCGHLYNTEVWSWMAKSTMCDGVERSQRQNLEKVLTKTKDVLGSRFVVNDFSSPDFGIYRFFWKINNK